MQPKVLKRVLLVSVYVYITLIIVACYPQYLAQPETIRSLTSPVGHSPLASPTNIPSNEVRTPASSTIPTNTLSLTTITSSTNISGRIAFVSQAQGKNAELFLLYVECINLSNDCNNRLVRLAQADVRSAPSWSPDGQWIAFADYRHTPGDGEPWPTQIYVINADGSNETRLTNGASHRMAPAWSPDGNRIAFTGHREGVYLINPDGGGLTTLTSDQHIYNNLSWSPDGKQLAMGEFSVGGWYNIFGLDIDGIQLSTQIQDDTHGLIFSIDWAHSPAWSPDGKHIAFVKAAAGNNNYYDVIWDIWVVNADGSEEINLTNNSASNTNPVWSPDGTHIAFVSNFAEIYLMNADGSGQTNLTNHPGVDDMPTWSPDGTYIAFRSTRDNPSGEIYVMNADGSRQIRLTNDQSDDYFLTWAPK